MVDRKFELRQEAPETYNKHLPDNQAYTSQRTTLVNEDGFQVAEVNTYLDNGYYGFHWQTTKSESELTQIAEDCVRYYEETYLEGLLDVEGEQVDPFGKNLPRDKYMSGVIVLVQENGKGDELELEYQRPFSYEQITKAAGDREVTLARFNSPIGDFIIQQYGGTRSFGAISHLRETAGFATVLAKSASVEVSEDEAKELLEKALSSFQVKS